MTFLDFFWPYFAFLAEIVGGLVLLAIASRIAGYGYTKGVERARRDEARRYHALRMPDRGGRETYPIARIPNPRAPERMIDAVTQETSTGSVENDSHV